MNKILVVKRSDDYHASLEGQPSIWGCGQNPREAIGNLVQSHPDMFGVQVELKY